MTTGYQVLCDRCGNLLWRAQLADPEEGWKCRFQFGLLKVDRMPAVPPQGLVNRKRYDSTGEPILCERCRFILHKGDAACCHTFWLGNVDNLDWSSRWLFSVNSDLPIGDDEDE